MSAIGTPLWELEDEELVRRYRTGSLSCFEELVRRYQVPLMRFLTRGGARRDEAEDLVQETFVRAYEHLDEYEAGRSFRAWMFTIAHRLAVSGHRKATLRLAEPLGEEASGTEPTPDEGVELREERGRLWDRVRQTLGEEPFTAVWLYYVEELTAPQIARVLGRSWVSVKTMLHRARRKLAVELAGEGPRQTVAAEPIKAGES